MSRRGRIANFSLMMLWMICAGCGPQQPSGGTPAAPDKIKIGFVVKQPEEQWFQMEWKFADQAARDLGFEVIKIGATDGEKALTAIDNLAAAGAQGMIVCTPDVKLGPALAAKAKANQLKIMAVDDRFIGADGQPMTDIPYLGISAGKIGQNAGNALMEQFKTRGWKIEETGACVVTFEELDTARERTDGAIQALLAAGFPQDRIFKAPQKTTDIPGSFDAVSSLLVQHSEVKRWLVAGMNETAVLGAIRAMEQGGRFDVETIAGVSIGGTDCIGEFQKPQPTGLYGSILLAAREHGYRTSEMMYRWIKDGVPPPPDTRTEGILITRETFRKILAEQGMPVAE
jgi:L-arabinose transport system substrate-binding protein